MTASTVKLEVETVRMNLKRLQNILRIKGLGGLGVRNQIKNVRTYTTTLSVMHSNTFGHPSATPRTTIQIPNQPTPTPTHISEREKQTERRKWGERGGGRQRQRQTDR